MATYVMEKGVPIPAKRKWGLAAALLAMEVGDSFVLDKPQSSIGTYMSRYKPKLYTTQKIDNNSCRVWRVA